MKRLLIAGVLAALMTACGGASPPLAAGLQPAADTASPPTATIRDIMDSMVDPSADVLWGAAGT